MEAICSLLQKSLAGLANFCSFRIMQCCSIFLGPYGCLLGHPDPSSLEDMVQLFIAGGEFTILVCDLAEVCFVGECTPTLTSTGIFIDFWDL